MRASVNANAQYTSSAAMASMSDETEKTKVRIQFIVAKVIAAQRARERELNHWLAMGLPLKEAADKLYEQQHDGDNIKIADLSASEKELFRDMYINAMMKEKG